MNSMNWLHRVILEEAVLKREIQNLGYEISQVDNGKVTFFGDAAAIAVPTFFCVQRNEFC